MKNEIGGYFGLELNASSSYHKNCYELNSARSSISVLLDTLKPKGILLPALNCPDVARHIKCKHSDVLIEFYHIDKNLDFFENLVVDRKGFVFYYANLFGLKNIAVDKLPLNTIVDNVHAFFALPLSGHHVIYSARKFFGVPDGSYLYTNIRRDISFPRYEAWPHAAHLLRRLDRSAQEGYNDFRNSEDSISFTEVRQMSCLSLKILASVDYARVASIRLNNFKYLHNVLEGTNSFSSVINTALDDGTFVPFSYPYLVDDGAKLRAELINNCVFVPKLWTFSDQDAKLSEIEQHVAANTVHLPIDQRYNSFDMDTMLQFIFHC